MGEPACARGAPLDRLMPVALPDMKE